MKKIINIIIDAVVIVSVFLITGFLLGETTDLKNDDLIGATVASTIIIVFVYNRIVMPIIKRLKS